MSAAEAEAPDRTAKGFRRGAHRAVPPEVTLARLLRLLDRMEITRVGMLTGLDRIGLPTATAIRPNGRAVSVSLGKGLSVEAAKVSAIMEAAESWHAERIDGPLRWGAARDIAGAVDPARLPLAAAADPGEDLAALRCLWIAGRDLGTGAARWVPFQLVHADYTASPSEPHRFQATTNGLAAGNAPVEARLHALYETIERDAIACWRARGGPAGEGGRPVDLRSADDPDLAALTGRLRAADVAVAVWDVSGDVGLPVFVALLAPAPGREDRVEPELGSGCHIDPLVALMRALTEAAQTRLARVAGARDDFEPESFAEPARRRRLAEAEGWLALASAGRVPWEAAAAGFARAPADDLETDLAATLEALARAGCGEIVWVDLSRPEIGLPVGRVIVPGLEGPWLPGRWRPGARARSPGR